MASAPDLYTPLPHPRAIRLLRVLSATPKEATKLLIELEVWPLYMITCARWDLSQITAGNDEEFGYNALSYTWGHPIDTPECEIAYSEINNVAVAVTTGGSYQHTINIGRNLYEALQHLWDMGIRGRIWADAICMNQRDFEEKAQQVRVMGEIYSRAQRVLVWFGVEDPQDPGFERLIRLHVPLLDQIIQWEAENGPVTADDWTHLTTSGMVALPRLGITISEETMTALHSFHARRRYLSRAWIVQEIVLSHDFAFAIMGSTLVQVARLADLASRAYASIKMLTRPGSSNSGNGEELRILVELARELDGRDHLDRREAFYAELQDIYGVHDDVSGYYGTWLARLSEIHHRQASDPRDIIYSLLAVVDAFTAGLRADDDRVHPDYEKSVEHVYQEFTARLLQTLPHRPSLSLVCGRQTFSGEVLPDLPASWPSWVPDYASFRSASFTITQICKDIWQRVPQFTASPPIEPRYSQLDINGQRLRLFGRKCQVLTTVHRPFPVLEVDEYQSQITHVYTWALETAVTLPRIHPTGYSNAEILFHILEFSLPTDDYPSDVSFTQRLWNSICKMYAESRVDEYKDILEPMRRRIDHTITELGVQPGIPTRAALDRFCELFAMWYRTDDSPKAEIEAHGQELEELRLTLRHDLHVKMVPVFNIFVTNGSYLGKLNNLAEPGDELWLLCQARVPFILRPVDEGYRLIGEAFVPGAMYGELIENGIADQPSWITIV